MSVVVSSRAIQSLIALVIILVLAFAGFCSKLNIYARCQSKRKCVENNASSDPWQDVKMFKPYFLGVIYLSSSSSTNKTSAEVRKKDDSHASYFSNLPEQWKKQPMRQWLVEA